MSTPSKVNWYAPLLWWRGKPQLVGCSTKAEAYAVLTAGAMGFPVFPIDASTKEPLIKWKYGDPPASTSVEQIQQWAKEFLGCNFALRTGGGGLLAGTEEFPAWGGRGGILVLDQDDGKVSDLPGTLPETRRVRTPSGGTHYYFTTLPGERIPSSQGKPIPGFDVRCEDGYVLLPGSKRKEKDYTVINPGVGMAPLPKWLRDALRVPVSEPDLPPGELKQVSKKQALEELEKILVCLRDAQPGDRGGRKYNAWVYRAGQLVKWSDLKESKVRSALRKVLAISGARSGGPKNLPWTKAALEDLLTRSYDAGLVAKQPPKGLAPPSSSDDGILTEAESVVETPEPFPEETLVGTAGDFARLYSVGCEAPAEAFFFSYLTLLGSAVSKKLKLASRLKVQPRLYTVLLGASASAKKSTAIEFAADHFRDLIPEQRSLLEEEDEIGGAETPRPTPDSPHLTMLYGMGSAEGIAAILEEEQKPITLIYDEFRSFVSKTSQEGAVGLEMLTSLFEQNNWANPTKKKKLVLRDAYMSILGACTAETYENMWTEKYLAIGFINRLFVVYCSRLTRVAMPEPVPSAAANTLKDVTRRQIEKYTKPSGVVSLALTEDALILWNQWYEKLGESPYHKRLDAYGLRLMLLLAVTTDADQIDKALVEKVLLLLDYELRVRIRVSPLPTENLIAKIEQKIRQVVRAHPGIKTWELKRRVHVERCGLSGFEWALDNLVKAGEIRQDHESGTWTPIIRKRG